MQRGSKIIKVHKSVPLKYDVIETGNVVDNTGLISLLLTSSPLLSSRTGMPSRRFKIRYPIPPFFLTIGSWLTTSSFFQGMKASKTRAYLETFEIPIPFLEHILGIYCEGANTACSLDPLKDISFTPRNNRSFDGGVRRPLEMRWHPNENSSPTPLVIENGSALEETLQKFFLTSMVPNFDGSAHTISDHLTSVAFAHFMTLVQFKCVLPKSGLRLSIPDMLTYASTHTYKNHGVDHLPNPYSLLALTVFLPESQVHLALNGIIRFLFSIRIVFFSHLLVQAFHPR